MDRARSSGILIHVSSLPGPFGIGDLGANAEKFAGFLSSAGFRVWQMLPVTPVEAAMSYSPYSSSSAFAGNTLFINPEKLAEDGLLSNEDIKQCETASSSEVNYSDAAAVKRKLLDKSWNEFRKNPDNFKKQKKEYADFCEKEKYWLDNYSSYSVLKEFFGAAVWQKWPKRFKEHDPTELKRFFEDSQYKDKKESVCWKQFQFTCQMASLRGFCKDIGISLVGDVPMFVSYDSSDVWANRDLFDLDQDGLPNSVAGVPPDYFSSTGQMWGNPLYNWKRMQNDEFGWWASRICRDFDFFDVLRIDHFRGLCACWSIPASAKNAANGKWTSVPGEELLMAVKNILGQGRFNIIAEDLGVITDDVRALMKKLSFPGMKVLLFAFGNNVGANPYSPHNISVNSVVYTGTHDNNTAMGWWKNEASEQERKNLETYTRQTITNENVADVLTAMALSSVAELAVIPMQDILSLGSYARMNTPGTIKNNWNWRLTNEEFNGLFSDSHNSVANKYMNLNSIYGRI